ncbi:hypothetical protein [Microcoleus sp. S13C4]|uniref:hypothetical protein n=1 Tax=Microcoleus sp. S13C4 TaxID=3055410 RepID=UPI002FD1DBD9
MTAKDQLLQELDQVPEPVLLKVLEFVRSLKTEQEKKTRSQSMAGISRFRTRKKGGLPSPYQLLILSAKVGF